jgi:hypothetical protein
VKPLYHYTHAANVLPIREQGLPPRFEDALSPHHQVVWLTTQPDVSVAPDDAKAMAAVLGVYETPLSALNRKRMFLSGGSTIVHFQRLGDLSGFFGNPSGCYRAELPSPRKRGAAEEAGGTECISFDRWPGRVLST